MQLFICQDLNEQKGTLGKEESHHASRVLRKQPGDEIFVTNGRGSIYKARITFIHKHSTTFDLLELHSTEVLHNHLHLAVAPTKSNDRFEFFLEKATECGVNEITPIISFNSERKTYKTARGEKVIAAAAKQSLSHFIPILHQPVSFAAFLKNHPPSKEKYVAWCGTDDSKKDILPLLKDETQTLVLIGPEGDFSAEEVEIAKKSGFKIASLGLRRLRTETAAIAVALASKLM